MALGAKVRQVMSPFVLEALCQAGTWLIMITTDRRKRAALLQVGSVTWHRDIRPGDVPPKKTPLTDHSAVPCWPVPRKGCPGQFGSCRWEVG